MTTGKIAEVPPRHKGGGVVGAYYLLTILAGVFVLFFHGALAVVADLIVTVLYIALTILFYGLSKKRLMSEKRDRTPYVGTAQSRKERSPDLLFQH
jgi:hypothetical protein